MGTQASMSLGLGPLIGALIVIAGVTVLVWDWWRHPL
jgi:hypothetical protein